MPGIIISKARLIAILGIILLASVPVGCTPQREDSQTVIPSIDSIKPHLSAESNLNSASGLTSTANPFYSSNTPFDSRIVFTRSNGINDGDEEIYVIDLDGKNQKRLTDSPGKDFQPDLSPDGQRVVFTSSRNGPYNIFIMNSDGSDQVQLTDGEGWSPAWSPSGSSIVYCAAPGDSSEIFVMRASGEDALQLTFDGANYEPQWSPTGQQIAFHADRAAGGVYVMDVDGHNQRQLSPGGPSGIWSPDGSKVLFSDRGNIFVMDLAEAELTQLTQTGSNDQPAWSPDGRTIAFVSNRSGPMEIWAMDVSGSHQVQVTHSGDDGYSPAEPAFASIRAVPRLTAQLLLPAQFFMTPPPITAVAFGPLSPPNPGGPRVEITLTNRDVWTVISLTATLSLDDSRHLYDFIFAPSMSDPLFMGQSVSREMNLIGGAVDSGATYPLIIRAEFSNGATWTRTVRVHFEQTP